MKVFLLASLLPILMIPNLFGEIRNGYQRDVPRLKSGIQYLRNRLTSSTGLTEKEKRQIRRKIATMVKTLSYAHITDILLENFRAVSPDIYGEIDSLTDSKGRVVDVYVKFIPKERAKMNSYGVATFGVFNEDPTRCRSEYGEHSVSVQIWITNSSLLVLSHEFGHLQHIIPNLPAYVQDYKRMYGAKVSTLTFGHDCNDAGGRSAYRFERRFRQDYSRYLKGDLSRVVSPFDMLVPAKRKVLADVMFDGAGFVSVSDD